MSLNRRHWRLRRRVFGSILTAGLLLTPFVLCAIWIGATSAEDAIFARMIHVEAERLVAAKNSGLTPEPAPFFAAFWGFDEITEPFKSATGELFLRRYVPIEKLEPGVYETRGAEAFVNIVETDDGPLILFFEIGDLEPLEDLEWIYFSSGGFVLALASLAVALGLARWLDREVLVPIRHLADAVGWDLETWNEKHLDSEARQDEIGHLSRSTRSAALRLLSFLERERQFTRNASHELRSPLTVIKGATELLRSRQDGSSGRPLDRIERAVRRMESTIEGFLFLAREEDDSPQVPAPILPAVKECLEHLPRRPDRQHHLRISISEHLTLPISPEALRILLDNLVGNALRHGAAGEVMIEADEYRFCVANLREASRTEPTEATSEISTHTRASDTAGVGLVLVEDLCRRYDWRLEISASDESWRTCVHWRA